MTARAETLLVFFKGAGTIAVSTADMKPLTDTLRLVTPVSFSVTLASGDLHIVSSSGRAVYAYASLTGAPAIRLSAEAAHIVLEKGGSGIRQGP
jgi:hypothetical protein